MPSEHASAEVMPDPSVMPRCPNCGWHDVRPSKPKGIDPLIGTFGLKPFRCRSCGHRFYRFYRHARVQD